MTDEGTAVSFLTGTGPAPRFADPHRLLAASAALLVLCSHGLSPAVAQDAAGGVSLTFGLNLRAETDSNADLDPVSAGGTSRATAGLSFALASETRSARLALDAGMTLQAESAPVGTDNGVTNPYVVLSFDRDAANAAFTLDASLRQTDLTTDREITDFDAETGTRRTARIDTGLRWGEARPLGFGLTAGITDTRYQDAPGEADSTAARVGLTARLDLSEVSRLALGLRASRFDEDGAPRARDTLGFDAGLSIDRARGSLGLNYAIDDTEDGQRQSLTFRHNLDLVRGTLAYSLGASRGVTGEIRPVVSLDYSLALPRSSLTLGLDRSVTADSEDAETVVTSVSLDYRQDLGPRSRISLSLNWATSETTATNLTTTNTNLGATYSHDLTEDWALDAGYRHRLRDEDGAGEGRSDSVFLGLRRDFSVLR